MYEEDRRPVWPAALDRVEPGVAEPAGFVGVRIGAEERGPGCVERRQGHTGLEDHLHRVGHAVDAVAAEQRAVAYLLRWMHDDDAKGVVDRCRRQGAGGGRRTGVGRAGGGENKDREAESHARAGRTIHLAPSVHGWPTAERAYVRT